LVPVSRSELDLFHVVVKDDAWPAAEVSKGLLMTVDQGGQAHRGGKAHEEHARVAEYERENVNLSRLAGGVGEFAGVGPIGLGLLAGRGLEGNGESALTGNLMLECGQEAAQRR